MKTNNYFFYISIPKDSHIEYLTKLNSFILKLFPGKTNPYMIRPMEINDDVTISKVTINSTEDEIVEFALKLFGNDYEMVKHENGDYEIAKKKAEPAFRNSQILH